MCNQKNAQGPLICMFDSGIGGLNLLRACVHRLPQADFCYFADNYNVPYGNLGEREIKRRVFGIFEKIAALHPDAAVVACNTVTTECITDLRAAFRFPIIGVEPAVKQAALCGDNFLVLATEATCGSASFKKLISKYGVVADVRPMPRLAEEIEQNIFSLDGDALAAGLPRGNFSSVVLGCTHYVFIEKAIKKLYCCPVFDGMLGTADHLVATLGKFDHLTSRMGKIAFFCGDFAKNKAVFDKINQSY